MICLPILLSMDKLTNVIQRVLGRKKGSAQKAKSRLTALQEQAVQETKKAA